MRMADQAPPTTAGRLTIDELLDGRPVKAPDWSLGLTPKQCAFLTEYLVDFNGRKAAIRSGLCDGNEKAAASCSSRYLRQDEVKVALAIAMADQAESRRLLRERIMQEVSTIAFYDIGDYVQVRANTVLLTDTDVLTEDQRRAVKKYKETKGKTESIEVEMHDKVKALALLDSMNGGGDKKGGTFNFNAPAPVQIVFDRGDAAAL